MEPTSKSKRRTLASTGLPANTHDAQSTGKPNVGKPNIGKLAEEIGKRDPFDLLEEEVYVSLMRTVDLLSSRFAELFAKYRLSNPLYNALRIVGGEQKFTGHGVPVGTISQRMVCRQPDTTRLIDRLESLGYVRRETCDVDARRRLVSLTPKGKEVLTALHRPTRDLNRRHFESLTPKALDQLNKLLLAVREGLS